MVEDCRTAGTSTQLCDDGTCVTFRTGYKCPEHPCLVGDKECQNKVQCYFSAYDHCDGSNDCDDGSDEVNCREPGNGFTLTLPKEVMLVVLIVVSFVVFCTILSIYIYCRKNNQRSNMRGNSLRMQSEIAYDMRGNSLRMQSEIAYVTADNIAGVHPGPPMCPSHINLPRVPCCPAHVSAVQSLLGHNGAAAPYMTSEEQPFIHHHHHHRPVGGQREWMEDFR